MKKSADISYNKKNIYSFLNLYNTHSNMLIKTHLRAKKCFRISSNTKRYKVVLDETFCQYLFNNLRRLLTCFVINVIYSYYCVYSAYFLKLQFIEIHCKLVCTLISSNIHRKWLECRQEYTLLKSDVHVMHRARGSAPFFRFNSFVLIVRKIIKCINVISNIDQANLNIELYQQAYLVQRNNHGIQLKIFESDVGN